jgi:hypothetical protein
MDGASAIGAGLGGTGTGEAPSFDNALSSIASADTAPALSGGLQPTADLFSPSPLTAGLDFSATAFNFASSPPGAFTTLSSAFGPEPRGDALTGAAVAEAQSAAGFDPAHNTELGGSYERSYDRAQATIAADPKLRAAVTMAEHAGDAGFRGRLATIMADLEHNPEAALNAVRGEVFSSQMRNRLGLSGADVITSLATLNAMDRLAAMQPDRGIGDAREQGFRSAVNVAENQRQAFYSIMSNPHLSFDQKMDRLAETGITDLALAQGMQSAAQLGATLGYAVGKALLGRVGRLAGQPPIAAEAVIPSDPFATRTVPTGKPGGQPLGAPERIPENANAETKFGIRTQNESLTQLADAGYNLVQHPKSTMGRDGQPLLSPAQQRALGLNPSKNPDALIEGRVFDVYASTAADARGVHNGIASKVGTGQAQRVVVNLKGTEVSPSELRQYLQQNPINNLKEIKVIDQSGKIVNFYPFQR